MKNSNSKAEFKGKKSEFCGKNGEIQLNSSQNSQDGFFEIYNNALNVPSIYSSWFERYKSQNLGAFITFCGIVRDENGIDALYFDICEPLLKAWFESWCERVARDKVVLCFAHSKGEVKIHQSSYFVAVISKQRKLGLRLINDFVEDFKANAPIWKYDVKNGEKIYALDRSHKIKNAGILG